MQPTLILVFKIFFMDAKLGKKESILEYSIYDVLSS